MITATAEKFGYPQRMLFENQHWLLLLRPVQVTLGSMVVVSKSNAESLATTSEAAFAAFPEICQCAERALKDLFGAEKFNYLALMMVDPHVHFHLIPRYSSPVRYLGEKFVDTDWPKPVEILESLDLSESMIEQLGKDLKSALPDPTAA
jgi:diadenosine tetraphosphate (Ap4A) HIT family hydrolase